MITLALKLFMTPFLIALITLIGQRFGPGIGGWLIGLPLVSAPISVILAVQNGREFAASAAAGTLSGLASVCAYCLVYSLVSQAAGWPVSIAAAMAAFLAVTALWNAASLPLLATFALNIVLVLLVLRLIPRRSVVNDAVPLPKWDIPARMVIATAFVLLLTGLAGLLGPRLAGLLSPFPVMTSVMAPFTQRNQGPAAVIQLLRGITAGLFGFTVFYLVVAGLLPRLPILGAYLVATLVTLAIHRLALLFV